MKHIHQQLVHDTTLIRREKHIPNCSDRYQGGDIREEDHRPEDCPALYLLIQQYSQPESCHQGERHREQAVYQCVFQSRHESVVGEEVPEIRDPYELQRIGTVPFRKCHYESKYDRPQREYRETDEIGCNERIGYQCILSLPRRHALLPVCRGDCCLFTHIDISVSTSLDARCCLVQISHLPDIVLPIPAYKQGACNTAGTLIILLFYRSGITGPV